METTRRAVVETLSPGETEALAQAMASRLTGGACIVLVGGLGAGKTAFVRGACRGLGVDEEILSPTFILYEAFAGRLPVVHVDLYRLEHEREIEELGVFDLIGTTTVLLAEWGDRSDTLMESADVVVEITGGDDRAPQRRRVSISWRAELDDALGETDTWSS